MKKNSKNAILIIGNGFDLAHGLKTSYNDFAVWFLTEKIAPSFVQFFNRDFSSYDKSIIKEAYVSQTIKDTLVGYGEEYFILDLSRSTSNIKDYKEKLNHIATELLKKPREINRFLMNYFLGKLYLNSYENWFDIESSYFSELNIGLSKDYPKVSEKIKNHVSIINSNFEEIKNALLEYLKTITPKKNEKVSSFFSNNFYAKENIFIANFNYTNTIDSYVNDFVFSDKKPDLKPFVSNIHIHGDLKSKIIFGYGDDDSDEYRLMKKTLFDEYLKNFKTFHYTEDNKYRELMGIIEGIEDYEVYVLGHSLGLTDKTLLYEILSPDKCLNIHLHKRLDIAKDEDKLSDTKKLIFNISRILNKDDSVRNKIVPFSLSTNFPYQEYDKEILKLKYKELYNITSR